MINIDTYWLRNKR